MKNSNNYYFKLYSNCILVKGAFRSSIYDLQKGKIRFIPNLLYKILQVSKYNTIKDLKDNYNNEFDGGIDLYFNQLKNEELGFFTDEPEMFPEIDTEFLFPGVISNVIIEVSETNNIDYCSLSSQLDDLGCFALEVRFQKDCTLKRIDNFLNIFRESKIKCIDILIHYTKEFEYQSLNLLRIKHLRLKEILVHNAGIDESYLKGPSIIRYTKDEISNKDCGNINKNYFSINIPMFTEALKYNTCLNKKLTVDVNGEIKNCPSMSKSYGNVSQVALRDVQNIPMFKEIQLVKKDDIKVCQDCEFRYACTDCRAFVDNLDDKYSRPSKCTYNPYQAKWDNDDGYIPVIEMKEEEIEIIKIKNA